MHVCIIETGHNEVAAEIDDLGLGSLQFANLGPRADREDPITAQGEGFGALARSKRSRVGDTGGGAGVDVAVGKDHVGFGHGS